MRYKCEYCERNHKDIMAMIDLINEVWSSKRLLISPSDAMEIVQQERERR